MKFKEILAALRGDGGKDDLGKIAAAMDAESSELSSIIRRRGELPVALEQALLDRDFATHEKLAAEAAHLDLRERAATARIGVLEGRKKAAEDARQAAAIVMMQKRFVAQYSRVKKAAFELAQANADAAALFDEAGTQFDGGIVARNFSRVSFVGLPLRDGVTAWASEMDAAMNGMIVRRPATPPNPPRTAPLSPAERRARAIVAENAHALPGVPRGPVAITAPHGAVLDLDAPERVPAPAPAQKRRAPRRDTPGEGQVLVTILRSGVELDGGIVAHAGDEIAMSPEAARELVRSAAADYADAKTRSEVPNA